MAGWISVIILACAWQANAQPERFNSVEAWRGSFIASAERYAVDQLGDRGAVTTTYRSYFMTEFLLDEFEDEPAVWRGRLINPVLDADHRAVARKVIDLEEGNVLVEEEDFHTNGPPEFGPNAKVELLFHRGRGWSLQISTPRRAAELTEKLTLTTKKGPQLRQQTQRQIWASAESGTSTRPYPARGLILFAGAEKSESERSIPGSIARDITWEYTVYLEPAAMEELRLEIEEPSGYETWRPETTPGRDPGPPLSVTARLVTVSGHAPQTRIERFIWKLQGTSREPGVALNFPLDATDTSYDLELAAKGEAFTLSRDNQQMERATRSGWTDTVEVLPYDWGAWSTLEVTAVLVDGRRVTGKLKGKNEPGLRVPKRSADSRIADGWKAQHLSGSDRLDDETIDGQIADGDGFALYEEYRGWIVDGQHLEGNPKAKDFFVLNLIGADAEPGIELFAAVSKLSVHSKLRPSEMSEQTRLMNGNHREGPRRLDQHGVWVKTFASKSELGDGGAHTVLNEKGVSGRPVYTTGIGVLPRDSAESIFNQPFNLRAVDTVFAYDRAIAHELLHSVGVEHHGEAPDVEIDVRFMFVDHPLNHLGRPYFATSEGAVIQLITEEGDDVAERYERDFSPMIKQARVDLLDRYLTKARKDFAIDASYNQPPKHASPEAQAELEFSNDMATAFSRSGLIGVPQGAHSGEEDCVMRYYFADMYPVNGHDDAFYVVAPGSEPVGVEICHSPVGTGINAADHKPQSRYGNAARGNCFEKICPNDAIPAW